MNGWMEGWKDRAGDEGGIKMNRGTDRGIKLLRLVMRGA